MIRMTDEMRSRIRESIDSIEEKTSLEFVPVLAKKSSNYLFFRASLSFLILFTAFASLEYLAIDKFSKNLVIATLCGISVALLQAWTPLLRHLLPRAIKLHEVEEAAHRVFLREEIFATPQRTGILIFISELEKAVFILADKGLEKKVSHQEWSVLGAKLAKDFQHQTAGETFLEALQELALRIAPAFPPVEGQKHSLSDEVKLV